MPNVRLHGRMRTRAGLIAGLLMLLTLMTAAPGSAHQGGPPDATEFRSSVIEIVDPETGESATGVSARIVGGDHRLEVTVTGDVQVVVRGYQADEYLVITTEEVLANRAAPAFFLNQDRLGDTGVPLDVTPQSRPDLVRVAEGPTFAWFDHRVHWTDDARPTLVEIDPDRAAPVRDWAVPIEVDGQQFVIRGRLDWLPGPGASPWIVLALLTLAVVVLLVRHDRDQVRAAAPLAAIAAGLGAVRLVDDLLAVEGASTSSIVTTVAPTVVVVVLATLALVRMRADHPQRAVTTGLAGIGAALLLGVGDAELLTGTAVQSLVPSLAPLLVVAGTAAGAASALSLLVPPGRRPQWGGNRTPRTAVALSAQLLVAGGAIAALVLLPARGSAAAPPSAAGCGGGSSAQPPFLFAGAPIPMDPSPAPITGQGVDEPFGITARGDDDPYTHEEMVTILRAGAVVAVHAPGDDTTADALSAVARQFPRRLAVTPGDGVETGGVTLTAWAMRQTCTAVTPEAVTAFLEQYAARIPTVPGS